MMDNTASGVMIFSLLGFGAMAILPVFHALRCGSGLNVAGALILVVVAFLLVLSGGLSGQISGLIVWAAAYIGAAICDAIGPRAR